MIQKVYDILKPLKLPVQYILRPDIEESKIGISYHFFNENYELYADGEGTNPGGALQIDIFSSIDYTDVVDQVKDMMKENNFRLADMRDSDDSFSNVKYYHKIMIFNYTESEVK